MIERRKVLEALARQRALGRVLRAHFEEFTDEQIPEDMIKLLNGLDEKPVLKAVRMNGRNSRGK